LLLYLVKDGIDMKETLECTQCDAFWKRKRTRGRKPAVCPDCDKLNKEQGSDQVNVKPAKETLETRDYLFRPISHWRCSTCHQTVSVHVGLNYAPLHRCRLKRNQMIALEQTTREGLKEITV
jgi:hypothetical protein